MQFRNIWIFKTLTVGLGLAVGSVVAELLLWALGIPYFHKAHSAPSQFRFLKEKASGRFFYVNTPSSTITFQYDSNPRGYFKPGNVVDHVTNAWGFRGREFSSSKQPGTVRLLFLGDSFTFGEGVHFEDTFAEATARLLTQRLARESLKVESYNLGVGGYNTADELALLKSVEPNLRPDAVILCYVLNDAEPPLFQVDPLRGPIRNPRGAQVPEGLDEPLPPKTLLYQSRIAQLVWRYAKARELNRQTEAYYLSLYRPESEGWQVTRGALHELGAFCQREKVPLIVMVFPILHELSANYPFRAIHGMVAQEADAGGALVLDLFPSFQGKSAADLRVHLTDQHPNEKAHRIAAETLAAKLASFPAFLEMIGQPPIVRPLK